MRRINIISFFTILILIAVGFYFFVNLQQQQIEIKKSTLTRQISVCGNNIEEYYLDFVDDVGYLSKYSHDGSVEITSPENALLIDKLKRLYLKYNSFISSIRVFDINGNMLIINKDYFNYFKIVSVSNSNVRNVVSSPRIIIDNLKYKYNIPILSKNGAILANISISISLKNYIDKVFSNYYLGSNSWQFLINSDGKILRTRFSEKNITNDSLIIIKDISIIKEDINLGYEGYLEHSVENNSTKTKLVSVYYPIDILNNRFGIIFSNDKSELLKPIRNKLIFFITSTLLIIGLIVLTFIILIRSQRKSEERVLQSLQAINSVVENVPTGIIIVDKKNIIRKINQSALNIFNLKNADVVLGKEYYACLNQDVCRLLFSAKNKFNVKSTFTNTNSEEITLLISSVPMIFDDEHFLIFTLHEITEIENAIRAQEEANKAKTEFLANISHEIRTPMNGIVGLTDLLDNTSLNEEQKEIVDLLQYSSDTMMHIINDILDFSKIEAGKFSLEKIPFDLYKLVQNISNQFKLQTQQKQINFETTFSSDIPKNLIGDPIRLQQVISNLLSNAIKFTEVGEIQFQISKHSVSDNTVELLFSIADTGIGIPKDSLNKIFLSFVQVDGSNTKKYGGTGLGTTISKQLVELMGGKIWVESPSKISTQPEYPGSVFYFTCKFLIIK